MNGNTKKKSMQNNNNNNNKKIMINVQLKNYEGCMKLFGENLSLVQADIPSNRNRGRKKIKILKTK